MTGVDDCPTRSPFGRPFWTTRRLPPLAKAALAKRESVDVLVVGAGISGALIAEMLASNGHQVLVVDRRGPALGSTAASTALVQYEIDEPLTALARRVGPGDAARAWRRSFQSLHRLYARSQALGIDAALDSRDSLYLAGDSLGALDLQREAEARRGIGLETTYLSRATLAGRFAIDRPAALLAHGEFGADPRRLTAGYLRAAIAAGSRFAAPLVITGIENARNAVEAQTPSGRIAARTVVFATGYEFPDFVPLHGHRLVSTFALATAPQPRRLWPGRCLVWEAADPYLYARTTSDGRAIIGGEDEDFPDEEARNARLEAKTRTIAKKAGKLFPKLDATPDFAWTGTFGISDTGLPTIAPVPGRPHCWAVLGYGGNGITYSRIAAEIIRTALAGGEDPDADLFGFGAGP